MTSSSGYVFRNRDRGPRRPMPYCKCKPSNPVPWKTLNMCHCGEEDEAREWKWESPDNTSWALLSDDMKTVTFHPYYSSGTASVRGNMPMVHNNQYYWEVKMLTETYGTDIMVGMCSDKAVLSNSQFEFKSLLGQDSESYGLSYKGELRHSASVTRDSAGFCRGTIVGVRLDMWAGTMEFYVNRKSQGVSFYNLRRHQALFPMLCSTAAQSSMRLISAASWRASLQQEAVKSLQLGLRAGRTVALPPGLWRLLKKQVWLNLTDTDEDGAQRSETEDENAARAAEMWVAKPAGSRVMVRMKPDIELETGANEQASKKGPGVYDLSARSDDCCAFKSLMRRPNISRRQYMRIEQAPFDSADSLNIIYKDLS